MKEWSSGLKLEDVLQMNVVKRYKDIAEMDNRKVNNSPKLEGVFRLSRYSLNHKLLVISILLSRIVVTRDQEQHQNTNQYFHV